MLKRGHFYFGLTNGTSKFDLSNSHATAAAAAESTFLLIFVEFACLKYPSIHLACPRNAVSGCIYLCLKALSRLHRTMLREELKQVSSFFETPASQGSTGTQN